MSSEVPTQVDSPGQQTLAGLKAEAVAEKTKSGCRKKQRKKPTQASGESRHRVPRACKVMKGIFQRNGVDENICVWPS